MSLPAPADAAIDAPPQDAALTGLAPAAPDIAAPAVAAPAVADEITAALSAVPGLGTPHILGTLTKGKTHEILLIQADGGARFVARIAPDDRGAGRLEREHALLAALGATPAADQVNAPQAPPLRTPAGLTILLSPYIDGRHAKPPEGEPAAPGDLATIARATAALHESLARLPAALPAPFDLKSHYGHLLTIALSRLAAAEISDDPATAVWVNHHRQFLMALLEAANEALGGWHPDGLIHGDIRWSNIIHPAGGRPPVFIDFDRAAYAPRALDHAIALFNLLWACPAASFDAGIETYVTSYRAHAAQNCAHDCTSDVIARYLALPLLEELCWTLGDHIADRIARLAQLAPRLPKAGTGARPRPCASP